MVYRDLRSFLEKLESEGQLLRVTQQVNLEPDLGSAARAINNLGDQSPALLFNYIHGYKNGRVALNVIGSWPNHALMMGLPKDTPVKEQFLEFARRWSHYPVPVERVDSAPFQANVITENINLFDILPLFRLNREDSGCFIDKACVISRDLDDPDHFGKQNTGIYRLQVKGKDRLGIQPIPTHDIGIHLRIAEERGENLPVAIAIGCDPVITTIAGSPLTYEQSEYEMAGAIQGAPYRIVRLKNTNLDIPWGAEVVLEGEIIAGKRELEGPFGEFTGSYSDARLQPIVQVKAIYFRDNPIFEHLYLGMSWTEMDYMTSINTCVPLYHQLKEAFPEVEAVNAMYNQGLVAIISTKTRFGGFAKAVGMRAMTTPHGLGYCKIVIVVDDFVDPFNLPQVMWALATRVAPDKDLVVIPNASVLSLDPSSEPPGITHKLIIDATTPKAPESRSQFAPSVEPPRDTVKWEKILKELMNKQGVDLH
ncbi:non-oxidative hydroxyarylic acid decarboxylases subunit C [Bacillus smithii]|uniref:non-oxidative hydroxyarylic acid decarboxylases subunit C n=1 Tax=Bacillus smithii TaxID=1479 RepID=UPI003D230533